MFKVMWTYWDQKAGVPKGSSKVHQMLGKWDDQTLCGIELRDKDCEAGHGWDDCKKCEKIAGRLE